MHSVKWKRGLALSLILASGACKKKSSSIPDANPDLNRSSTVVPLRAHFDAATNLNATEESAIRLNLAPVRCDKSKSAGGASILDALAQVDINLIHHIDGAIVDTSGKPLAGAEACRVVGDFTLPAFAFVRIFEKEPRNQSEFSIQQLLWVSARGIYNGQRFTFGESFKRYLGEGMGLYLGSEPAPVTEMKIGTWDALFHPCFDKDTSAALGFAKQQNFSCVAVGQFKVAHAKDDSAFNALVAHIPAVLNAYLPAVGNGAFPHLGEINGLRRSVIVHSKIGASLVSSLAPKLIESAATTRPFTCCVNVVSSGLIPPGFLEGPFGVFRFVGTAQRTSIFATSPQQKLLQALNLLPTHSWPGYPGQWISTGNVNAAMSAAGFSGAGTRYNSFRYVNPANGQIYIADVRADGTTQWYREIPGTNGGASSYELDTRASVFHPGGGSSPVTTQSPVTQGTRLTYGDRTFAHYVTSQSSNQTQGFTVDPVSGRIERFITQRDTRGYVTHDWYDPENGNLLGSARINPITGATENLMGTRYNGTTHKWEPIPGASSPGRETTGAASNDPARPNTAEGDWSRANVSNRDVPTGAREASSAQTSNSGATPAPELENRAPGLPVFTADGRAGYYTSGGNIADNASGPATGAESFDGSGAQPAYWENGQPVNADGSPFATEPESGSSPPPYLPPAADPWGEGTDNAFPIFPVPPTPESTPYADE